MPPFDVQAMLTCMGSGRPARVLSLAAYDSSTVAGLNMLSMPPPLARYTLPEAAPRVLGATRPRTGWRQDQASWNWIRKRIQHCAMELPGVLAMEAQTTRSIRLCCNATQLQFEIHKHHSTELIFILCTMTLQAQQYNKQFLICNMCRLCLHFWTVCHVCVGDQTETVNLCHLRCIPAMAVLTWAAI